MTEKVLLLNTSYIRLRIVAFAKLPLPNMLVLQSNLGPGMLTMLLVKLNSFMHFCKEILEMQCPHCVK